MEEGFDLLVSGDAIVETITGGPVRLLSFWLARLTFWPGTAPPKGTRALSEYTPALRIACGLTWGLGMGDIIAKLRSLFINSIGTV